jgi:PPOX class probable F420-dependent enzyme
MTRAEALAFLVAKPRTAQVATVRADGRPHVATVWIAVDGETVVFTTWHESVKAHNLRRDPRISLIVDDDRPPYAYVILDGAAELVEQPDPEELRAWATRIARRYMGDELADAFGERNGVPGELLVWLRPDRIVGHAGISDP